MVPKHVSVLLQFSRVPILIYESYYDEGLSLYIDVAWLHFSRVLLNIHEPTPRRSRIS